MRRTGYPSLPALTALLAVIAYACPAGDAGKDVLARYDKEIKPLLTQFCFQCHSTEKKKGNVILDEAVTIEQLQKKTNLWLAAQEQVRGSTMPPEEAKEMDKKQIEIFTRWVTDAIAAADAARPRDPGFIALHRLNRTEYNNTVRDLTGIEFKPAADFPADDSGYGFDNIADVLTMSPLLAERYLSAAEQVVDRIIKEAAGIPSVQPVTPADAKARDGVRGHGVNWAYWSNGEVSFTQKFLPGAEYVMHFEAWQQAAGDEDAKLSIRLDGKEAGVIEVDALQEKPKKYPVRFKAGAESQKVAMVFINDFYDEKNKNANRRDRNVYVDGIEIEGPFNAPRSATSKKVFIATPSKELKESDCAEKIIKEFARKAFRRPVKEPELKSLLKIYATARKAGTFEYSVGQALMAVLVSPHFLFRVEKKTPVEIPSTPDNPLAAWPVDDHELAVRLSYFLWSTMPDDELAAIADQKKIRSQKTREEQTRRMLKDPRISQLVENFAGQWLELRNLDDITRDHKLFPAYNNKLMDAMSREAILFFDSVVREDRSIITLIDADYTFVNEPLAEIYGLKDVKGDEFRRVPLQKDSPRGGVITMSSTLALTANPTRTSPVKRGKWVLEQILGSPPPPPPPEVPTLPEKTSDQAGASLKSRLEKHRSDPNCAVCHIRMDGLGFALENFDSIGQWRDKDGSFAIDAKGELPGGEVVDGPRALKTLVLARRGAFARAFVEKMLTYALGRGIKPHDRPTVNEIVKYVEQNEYKFSSVVLGIVNSDAFLRRREKRGDE